MLLKLKASYKELTGDAPPGAGPAGGGKKKDKKQDGAGAGGGKKEGKKDKGGKEASKPAGKAEGKKEDGGKRNEWRGGSDEVYLCTCTCAFGGKKILSLSCTAAGDGQGPKKETMYVTFIFKCVLFYVFIVLLH